MNIVFTNAYFQKRVEYTSLISVVPPLDLAYCAALLRQQIPAVKPVIIDANALRLGFEEQCEHIRSYNPQVVVVTAQTHSINAIKRLANTLKKDDLWTVLVGTHGSALPRETLEEIEGLDVIIRGEPERTLLGFINAVLCDGSLSAVNGIAYREDKNIVVTTQRDLLRNLDELPCPARDLLPNNNYFSPYAPRVTALQTTRGCPGQCRFCDSHVLYGERVRMRNPVSVVDEIEECVERYRTQYFAVIDHTFTAHRSFVTEVCQEIINRGLHKKIMWVCNTRVDLLNDEMLMFMKRAGCLQIGIGVESGDNARLARVRKGITEEQIALAIERIKRHGIIAMGYAIIGFPHETRDDIERTKQLIFKFNPHTLQLSFATPLPGSELYEACREENRIVSDSWDDYVFLRKSIIRNDTVSTETLEQVRHSIVSSFYFRPKKIGELVLFMLFRVRVNYINCVRAFFIIIKNLFCNR